MQPIPYRILWLEEDYPSIEALRDLGFNGVISSENKNFLPLLKVEKVVSSSRRELESKILFWEVPPLKESDFFANDELLAEDILLKQMAQFEGAKHLFWLGVDQKYSRRLPLEAPPFIVFPDKSSFRIKGVPRFSFFELKEELIEPPVDLFLDETDMIGVIVKMAKFPSIESIAYEILASICEGALTRQAPYRIFVQQMWNK